METEELIKKIKDRALYIKPINNRKKIFESFTNIIKPLLIYSEYFKFLSNKNKCVLIIKDGYKKNYNAVAIILTTDFEKIKLNLETRKCISSYGDSIVNTIYSSTNNSVTVCKDIEKQKKYELDISKCSNDYKKILTFMLEKTLEDWLNEDIEYMNCLMR